MIVDYRSLGRRFVFVKAYHPTCFPVSWSVYTRVDVTNVHNCYRDALILERAYLRCTTFAYTYTI